jgi:ornithine racemase
VKYPRIVINLSKIEHNARVAVDAGAHHGVSIIGVTKACLGSPEVARAMLAGGVSGLGDSRLENLNRLRAAGIAAPLTMLRLPMLSEADDTVRAADTSLNSDLTTIRSLGRAAAAARKRHRVILMVDTGDRREGVDPESAGVLALAAGRIGGIELAGVGTNVACLAGCSPTAANLALLIAAARIASQAAGRTLPVISGGNSSAWDLMISGKLPKEVNELRLGEAILLARETSGGHMIPEMAPDAFAIQAEIIESLPARSGHHIAALGLQDVAIDDLTPVDENWAVVKGSSDHLVLTKRGAPAAIGDYVSFRPGYTSLLRSMTSQFVTKQYV